MAAHALQLVESQSAIGGLINVSALAVGMGEVVHHIPEHHRGLFLVEADVPKAQALGYVGCMEIINGIGYDPDADGPQASIGNLYVLPAHRKQGHATNLVKTLTGRLFESR